MASALVTVVLVASACGGDESPAPTGEPGTWDAVVAAAEREGKVVLYSVLQPDRLSALEEAFEQKYDIDLEVVRANSSDTIARIDQERAAGVDGADVTTNTESGWFAELAAEGQLLELSGPSAELWAGLDRFNFGNKYFVYSLNPWVIAWNTDLVSEPLTSYEDFLRPDLKGNVIGTVGPVSTPVVANFLYLRDTFGEDYMTRLAEQGLVVYPSVVPAGQALGSGEVSALIFTVPSALKELQNSGAPIEFAFPKPVTFANTETVGALGWSRRPNAAQVLLDFMLSVEGQTALFKGGISASPLDSSGRAEIPNSLDGTFEFHDLSKISSAEVNEFISYFEATFQ